MTARRQASLHPPILLIGIEFRSFRCLDALTKQVQFSALAGTRDDSSVHQGNQFVPLREPPSAFDVDVEQPAR